MSNPPAYKQRVDLPDSIWPAMLRGLRSQCPRCGEAELFRKWLKPHDTCAHCGMDWSVQQADDFPAYIALFVTGHALAPVAIAMIGTYGLSPYVTLAVLLPLTLVMTLGMLQPVKGAVIALLWWWGVGAFTKERPMGQEQADADARSDDAHSPPDNQP